jgi:uncharacterized protein (UPF0276 family)
MTVHVGLSLMPTDAYRSAVLPLFEDGIVDAIEWSFDQGWGARGVPVWATPLLDLYAQSGRLWGHGVTYSAGSVDGEPQHSQWLDRLREEIELRPLRGVSEHFGFMVASDRNAGAPLPPGFGVGTRDVLVRNLSRLRDVASVQVGLENLALALCRDECWLQGPLLADVLAAVDGYLVLDLHNLWCQIANYDLDATALLATYPLDRVRCMHVAGGRWWDVPGGGRFRRDTHDGAVPGEVMELLGRALPLCPAVECVVLERIGDTVADAGDAEALRRDFIAIRERVVAHG